MVTANNLKSFLLEKYNLYSYVKFSKDEMLNNVTQIENLEDIKNIGFCMITPDAVVRHLIPDIIKKLKENNISILDYQVKYLTEEDIEEIYKMGFTQKILANKKTHWWLTQKSYSIAPAIGLIVFSDTWPSQYETFCDYLLTLKGKSSPCENLDKKTIRAELGSISKTLSLFHSSDDMFAMIREAKIFFSWERILRSINQKKEINNKLIESTCYQSNYHNTSGFDVFYFIKIRAISTCIHKLRTLGFTNKSLDELLDKCLETVSEFAFEKEYNTCVDIFNKSNEKEKKLRKEIPIDLICSEISSSGKLVLENWNVIEDNINILDLIQLIVEDFHFDNYSTEKGRKIFSVLKNNEIYISEWEKICLENLLFFI